ncbi:Gag protease polyprotein [Gossypium australe]|uniref:Gag protease polyprotein n=1 Tax=Gossypium australe TaxID=47621 RepID=A0A5B6WN31_9ROSI|nr:Gag protease polyprotein [Gossypium australe]
MTRKELNLRQRRWLELLKDYDMIIDYYLGKANIVVNALCRKSLFSLRLMNVQLQLECDGSILDELRAKLLFLQNIRSCNLIIRICWPNREWLRMLKYNILNKVHNNIYSLHPGSTKMYCDLKQIYWWPRMKHEIFKFVSKCLVCQQVKAEHQVPSRLLQHIMIP